MAVSWKAQWAYVAMALIPIVALVVGLIVVLSGGSSELDDARERWRDNGPTTYSMTYTITAQAGEAAATVLVTDGRVDSAAPVDDGDFVADGLTVEDLFDAIDAADQVVEVEYDPELGYPRRAVLDVDSGGEDDGWSFTVTVLDAVE